MSLLEIFQIFLATLAVTAGIAIPMGLLFWFLD